MAYEQLKLDNQLCFRVYTAARLITSAYTPFFKELGITYPQYLVLLLLWEKDKRTVGEITSSLQLETNTVTPLLQRMEKSGLIARTKADSDSRQRIISLTDAGKKMEERAKDIPTCIAHEISATGGMPQESLGKLIPLLDQMIAALMGKE